MFWLSVLSTRDGGRSDGTVFRSAWRMVIRRPPKLDSPVVPKLIKATDGVIICEPVS